MRLLFFLFLPKVVGLKTENTVQLLIGSKKGVFKSLNKKNKSKLLIPNWA